MPVRVYIVLGDKIALKSMVEKNLLCNCIKRCNYLYLSFDSGPMLVPAKWLHLLRPDVRASEDHFHATEFYLGGRENVVKWRCLTTE